jgi:hypothetical protein
VRLFWSVYELKNACAREFVTLYGSYQGWWGYKDMHPTQKIAFKQQIDHPRGEGVAPASRSLPLQLDLFHFYVTQPEQREIDAGERRPRMKKVEKLPPGARAPSPVSPGTVTVPTRTEAPTSGAIDLTKPKL